MHSPLHPPCVGSGMEGAGLLHIMLRGGKVGTGPGFRLQDGHCLPGGAWRRVSPLSTNSTAGSGVRWAATWVSTELQKEDRCSPAGARLEPWLLCLEKSHHPGEWPSDTRGAGGHGGATWERWPKAFGRSKARLASIVQVWPAGERGTRELPQHDRLSPLRPATARLLVRPGTHGRVDR